MWYLTLRMNQRASELIAILQSSIHIQSLAENKSNQITETIEYAPATESYLRLLTSCLQYQWNCRRSTCGELSIIKALATALSNTYPSASQTIHSWPSGHTILNGSQLQTVGETGGSGVWPRRRPSRKQHGGEKPPSSD